MKDIERFVVENYKRCWAFLLECRWFVVFIVGLFALSFLVGFTWPHFFEEKIFEMLKMMVLEFGGKGAWESVWMIFVNNLIASFIAMLLGIGIGIFPLMACVMNGYLAGFVGRYASEIEGVWILWKLLPHGIFELPAVLISMGIGLRLGLGVLGLGLKSEGGGDNIKSILIEGCRFFVFVILPLLLLAAIIEGVLISITS
jgi:stage II sporulation protein M